MARKRARPGARVLGSHIDALGWTQCLERIGEWAARGDSCAVMQCNVHSAVTARRDPRFAAVLRAADLVTPDGWPIAWCLRRLGFGEQERIGGPDLMWRCCALAAERELPVYLYGANEATLTRLRVRLRQAWPRLRLAGWYAPPYGALSQEEDASVIETIEHSGARIVFVALGCPKQEAWIAAHRGRIHAVMLGVGAAFDFHAGVTRRAPRWMQDNGLEWLHRLASEPRRLWRRYLVTNTLFIAYLAGELLRAGSGYR